MSAPADREWQNWAVSWREDAPLVDGEPAIRAIVTRQSRQLRVVLALECLVTIVVMGLVVWVAVAERTAAAIAWGVVAVAHSVVVWAFTLWNRTGLWRPLSQAVGDCLALALARCESEVRAARFAFWLVSGESAAAVIWVLATPRSPQSTAPDWWWLPPTGATAVAVVWSIWFGRRARHRAERLRLLAAELES